jgi:hypothetical protein
MGKRKKNAKQSTVIKYNSIYRCNIWVEIRTIREEKITARRKDLNIFNQLN